MKAGEIVPGMMFQETSFHSSRRGKYALVISVENKRYDGNPIQTFIKVTYIYGTSELVNMSYNVEFELAAGFELVRKP